MKKFLCFVILVLLLIIYLCNKPVDVSDQQTFTPNKRVIKQNNIELPIGKKIWDSLDYQQEIWPNELVRDDLIVSSPHIKKSVGFK
jgi:hypothetical protein